MQRFNNISALCLSALLLISCASTKPSDQLPSGLVIASNACDSYKSKDCYEEDNYDYEKDFSEIPLELESETTIVQKDVAEQIQSVNPVLPTLPAKKKTKPPKVIESKKVDVEIIKHRPTLKEKYNISVEINDIATERTVDRLNNPEKYERKIDKKKIVPNEQIITTNQIAVENTIKPDTEKASVVVEKQEITPTKQSETKSIQKKLKKQPLSKAKKESDFFLEEVYFSDLPNFEKDNIKPAFETFMKSCKQFEKTDNLWIKSNSIAIDKSHMMEICADAINVQNELPKYKKSEQKKLMEGFFMQWFSPYKVFSKGTDSGTFTGYYEAHIKGSTTATCDYLYPIYAIPDDKKYQTLTREEIENGAIRGKAKILFWAKNPVDIFITQIQGSGVIETENGKQYRIGYAGNNGYQFTGTGEAMKQMGIRPEGGLSMNSVRDYMKKNPTTAQKIMNKNKRFIFFKENNQDGAIGTLGTTLTPNRTIAVDTEYIPLGLPMYVNVSDPDGKLLDRVVVAADTGTAIKGGIRADFFFGFGEEALKTAGRMKQTGKYFIFLPKNRDKFMVKSDNIHCLN